MFNKSNNRVETKFSLHSKVQEFSLHSKVQEFRDSRRIVLTFVPHISKQKF